MKKDISEQLDAQYRELQDTIDLLERGECKPADVKHKSALLGIYRERNGTYMCRVRRNAGQITAEELRNAADIIEENKINHGHFSTRQNLQLHGVPAENVYNTISSFGKVGMTFRGGGGNTFRSVATGPYSGVSATETFDTIPHTAAVWDFMYGYENAYGFGRKFKLGFTSEEHDDSNAGIQDLGFVAKINDKGEQGFRVYSGGGMGRGANLGIVIFDFVLEKEIIRIAQAGVDLFFEHGNREVRSKARLRFRLQEWGEAKYRETFLSFYEKADAPDFVPAPIDYESSVSKLTEGSEEPTDGFDQWKIRSVKDTKFGDDVKSVRLFVRGGNFKAQDLRELAGILDATGAPELRSAITQDIIFPLVHKTKLPELYRLLNEKLPEQATTDGSFTRHVVSCIGAAQCPIGILQAPVTADKVAKALEELIAGYSDIAPEVYESILDGINISGCASSCGLNLCAGIGFNGLKKKIDGVLTELYQVHIGGEINESNHQLAKTDAEWLVKADEIDTFVVSLVKEYLDLYTAGTVQTLREFMIGKRDTFTIA